MMLGAAALVVSLLAAVPDGHRVLAELVHLRQARSVAEGRVTAVRPTRSGEGKKPIFENDFSFVDNAGRAATGRSYTPKEPLAVGSAVTVDYVADQPQYARIRGARYATFGTDHGVFFPVLAVDYALLLLVVRFRLRRGRHLLRCLREGRMAPAGVVTDGYRYRASEHDYELELSDTRKRFWCASAHRLEPKDFHPVLYLDAEKSGLSVHDVPGARVVDGLWDLGLSPRWQIPTFLAFLGVPPAVLLSLVLMM